MSLPTDDPDMPAIASGILRAREYGLTVEFVWSLVNEIRGNPKIETAQAVANAMYEWDI